MFSTVMASSAYTSAAQTAADAQKQVELAKIRLEQERLYTPDERMARFHAEQEIKQKQEFHHKTNILKNRLMQWSRDRCSPVTHHSVADEEEVGIMTLAHEVASKHTDSLKNVFETQKSSCGTSDQYKNIYGWLNKVLGDH